MGPFSPPKKKPLKKLQGKNSSQKEILVSRTIRDKRVWWTGFFLWRIFVTWRHKKRAGESNKGIFLRIKKTKSPYLEKKKVESRQI